MVVLVTKAVLAVKPPSYAQILELDEKIDELKDLDIHDADPNSDQTSITMRAFVRAHYTCLSESLLVMVGFNLKADALRTSSEDVLASWSLCGSLDGDPFRPVKQPAPPLFRISVRSGLCGA